MDPNTMNGAPEEKSFGATIAIIIIILVLVVGGYYVWKSKVSPQTSTDDLTSIEDSLNKINVGDIDTNLVNLEANL